MLKQPVTFYFPYEKVEERLVPYVMHCFAAAGAKHLVFSDAMFMEAHRRPYCRMIPKYLEMAKSEGLDFVDAHAPFGRSIDLDFPEPSLRRQIVLRHQLHLNMAAEAGVNTMTIHVGNDIELPGVPVQTLIDNVCQALDELLPEAEKCGVTIAIENIWFRPNTPDRLLEIKSKFPTPFLGFCYDAGHANLMDKGRSFPDGAASTAWAVHGETPVWEDHALEKMLPYVVNCHLHDNDGRIDQHRAPGRGTVDWPHVMKLLREAPNLRCVQSEVAGAISGDPIASTVEAFDRLAAL